MNKRSNAPCLAESAVLERRRLAPLYRSCTIKREIGLQRALAPEGVAASRQPRGLIVPEALAPEGNAKNCPMGGIHLRRAQGPAYQSGQLGETRRSARAQRG